MAFVSGKTRREGVNVHNVIVIPSDNKSNFKRISNYTSYLVTSVIKGVFLKSPDVVIATSPPIFAALGGLIIAKLKGAKFVLDVRDIWPESAVQMGSIRNRVTIKFLEWLEVTLYRNSSLITVATPGMVDLIKAKIPRLNIPVKYVPCGVEIPDESRLKPKGRSPFDVDMIVTNFVFYMPVFMCHAQNLITIVDAANLLKKRDEIVFYFIGAGPDKERVVAHAAQPDLPNVKFLEPVDRDLIRSIFRCWLCYCPATGFTDF